LDDLNACDGESVRLDAQPDLARKQPNRPRTAGFALRFSLSKISADRNAIKRTTPNGLRWEVSAFVILVTTGLKQRRGQWIGFNHGFARGLWYQPFE
jgi:hypothetical protein